MQDPGKVGQGLLKLAEVTMRLSMGGARAGVREVVQTEQPNEGVPVT